jgi:thiosulfate/3-mercaptopyruvate sulfurtransferase
VAQEHHAGVGRSPVELPGLLVEAAWLAAHAAETGLVVLHCDGDGTSERFARGHVPGARYANLRAELSDRGSAHAYTLPSSAELAGAFGALGVADDSTVVCYDADNGAWAARVLWNLRAIGFAQAAVLNGGLRAWLEAGGPLVQGESIAPALGPLPVRPDPGAFAQREQVEAVVDDRRRAQLLSNGSCEQYLGSATGGDLRPGHIPGSRIVPAAELLDERGRLRSLTDLQAVFEGAGIDVERPVITYCGAGIAASLGALALAVLGNREVSVYDGSLQEWSADPRLPLQVGEDPG